MSKLYRLSSYMLLLLVFNTGLWSCVSKCRDLPFTPQAREYFLDFKEGSYWIYRNVSNGDLDSVYFVSQTITQDGGSKGGPICSQEYAQVNFNGFADNLPFGYYIKSWNNEMEISNSSAIAFRGDFDLAKSMNEVLGGVNYSEVVTLAHCCFNGCNSACDKKYFRFLRLSYSPRIGLVRWEAENHPKYGNAVYELIRYKIVR